MVPIHQREPHHRLRQQEVPRLVQGRRGTGSCADGPAEADLEAVKRLERLQHSLPALE